MTLFSTMIQCSEKLQFFFNEILKYFLSSNRNHFEFFLDLSAYCLMKYHRKCAQSLYLGSVQMSFDCSCICETQNTTLYKIEAVGWSFQCVWINGIFYRLISYKQMTFH